MKKASFIKKNNKYSLDKIHKKFLGLSLQIKCLWILSLFILTAVVAFIIYFYTTIAGFSINLFYARLIVPLGFDVGGPLTIFVVLSLIMGIPIYFYVISRLTLNKSINWYLLLGIFILLFFMTFGLSFVNQTYSFELPREYVWNYENQTLFEEFKSNNCTISTVYCTSLTNKRNFVIGDEVLCNANINEDCEYYIDELNLIKNYNNQGSLFETLEGGYHRLVFTLGVEENIRQIEISPRFSDLNSSKESKRFLNLKLPIDNKYDVKEYNQRNHDKVLLIMTLVSIIFMSAIISMNNLKQLMEPKNK